MILLFGSDSAFVIESNVDDLRLLFANTTLTTTSFKLQNLQEAQEAAILISQQCPNSSLVAMGVAELIFNAIEHGNLGIGYEEKSKLFKSKHWVDEVERRLALPNNVHKFVTVHYLNVGNEIKIRIIDEGPGFNWREFHQQDENRVFDTHGRGIILAQNAAFKDIIYHGNGNEVECIISLI